MKTLLPTSRSRFTAADLSFLESILTPGDGAHPLRRLWEDPEALQEILDLKAVFRATLESPATLEISPAFYFFVLVRHAFLKAGIEDVAVADYVAAVLADRATADPNDPFKGIPGGIVHVADFIAILDTARGRHRFHLQIAAGNQFLVLTGIYPEFLRHRAERCGAPNLAFYESFGARIFREAADHPLAASQESRQVLGCLSECFPEARRTLNRVSSDYLFLRE